MSAQSHSHLQCTLLQVDLPSQDSFEAHFVYYTRFLPCFSLILSEFCIGDAVHIPTKIHDSRSQLINNKKEKINTRRWFYYDLNRNISTDNNNIKKKIENGFILIKREIDRK